MRICTAAALGALLSVVAVLPARGDTLELVDGRVFEGRVVSEPPGAVLFETASAGIKLIRRVPQDQVRTLRREVRAGVGYCVVPLVGEIGRDVSGEAFREALNAARGRGAKVVVLAVDSPGGSIQTQWEIVDAMAAAKDLTFVAYVKRALSAAAIVSLACPQIVMAPEGTIGAAVPFRLGPGGGPKLLDEKAYSVVRARNRAASELGGRSDLWARGMAEGDLELALFVDDQGKPHVVEAADAQDAEVIKRKGEILALTASEASAWGLSCGTAPSVAAARDALGLAAWHDAGNEPALVMTARARAAKARLEELRVRGEKAEQRLNRVERVAPQIAQIDAQVTGVMVEAERAVRAARKLRDAKEEEAIRVREEYDRNVADARSAGRTYDVIRAQGDAKAKALAIRKRYDPQIAAADQKARALLADAEVLMKQRKALVGAMLPGE